MNQSKSVKQSNQSMGIIEGIIGVATIVLAIATAVQSAQTSHYRNN